MPQSVKALICAFVVVSTTAPVDSQPAQAAVTRQEAIDLVTTTIINASSHFHEIVAYIYPTQLSAGDEVHPGMEPQPGDTISIINDTWFIYIDDHSMDRWTHNVRYAFVDSGGVLFVRYVKAWPVVGGVPQWDNNAAIVDALNNGDVIYGHDNILFEEDPGPGPLGKFPSGFQQNVIHGVDFPELSAIMATHDYGIICGGTNDARDNQGVDSMKNAMGRSPMNVPDGNTFSGKNCTKQQFCDALDSIAARGDCEKLYVTFIGHGGQDDGNGNWYLWFENGDGTLTGKEMRDKIKKTKAKKVCIVIEACYSGCLIPYLRGAADSVEIATSADKNSTSRSWTYFRYQDNNMNGMYDSATDVITSTRIVNHYWDSFIGCLDTSRNWQQTHEWAVAQLDSADSAHQNPQYGNQSTLFPSDFDFSWIKIPDNILWLGLPPSAPPQLLEIDLFLAPPDQLGAITLPLQIVTVDGAFPIIDPFLDPLLGFSPLLGPPIFDNVFVDPFGVDNLPPNDFWLYQLQSLGPPDLPPGFYDFARPQVVDLLPVEGTFIIDTINQPPIPPLQAVDPTITPIPFLVSPGEIQVLLPPVEPPLPSTFLFLEPPPDPFVDPFDFTLTFGGPLGVPLDPLLATGPPGTLLLPPGPIEAGLELHLQAVVPDPSQDTPFRVEIYPSGEGGKSASPQTHDPLNVIEWIIPAFATGCACDCHADPANCEGTVDVFDVVSCVDEAFRSGLPVIDPNPDCPVTDNDANCDLVVDVFDVVAFVEVAFRNGDPAVEFCDPCAP